MDNNTQAGYEERLKNYTLMDDVFFRAFIRDNYPAAEQIFKVVLQKDDVKVTNIETQRDLKSLKGHSLLLDCSAKVDGKPADLEIQNEDAGASYRRARYHSSMLDTDSLLPGQDFDLLPDTYVVFITEHDVIGYSDSHYVIERVIKGRNTDVDDGSHIIYVNGSYKGKDDFGWLMHDFHCKDPDKMHFPDLRKTAKFLKETEKGVARMYSAMDELKKEGRKEASKDIAINLIRESHMTDAAIARACGLTEAEVKKLREQEEMAMA